MKSAQETDSTGNSITESSGESVVNTFKNPAAFFISAYLVQGVSQHFGILSQPLQFHLMQHEGLPAAGVQGCMTLLMVPWIIKPLYAFFSDFVPIAGYRRRSYLLLSSAIAGIAMISVPLFDGVNSMMVALFAGSVGMAFANVVLNALTIEACLRDAALRNLWSTQSLAYYSANIGCAALGGYLCKVLGDNHAVDYAAVGAGLMPLLFMFVILNMVREKRESKQAVQPSYIRDALWSCLKSPGYLPVCIYLCLFNLSPICGVPVYFFESKVLNFDQGTIGQLNACTSFGMLCGGLIFKLVFEKLFGLKNQLVVTGLISSAATLGYVLLSGDVFAASVIHFCWGIASTVSILALYGVASTVCPRRIEAMSFAFLIATYNGVGQLGQLVGGNLYDNVFNHQIAPLMCLSASISFACAMFALFAKRREGGRVL